MNQIEPPSAPRPPRKTEKLIGFKTELFLSFAFLGALDDLRGEIVFKRNV
jgi:hypothetical protein